MVLLTTRSGVISHLGAETLTEVLGMFDSNLANDETVTGNKVVNVLEVCKRILV